MKNDDKEPIKPDENNPDLTGNNEAGDTKTTSREYIKRERGNQNVSGVPVGNPVENADNDPPDEPASSSSEEDEENSSTKQ